MIDLSLGGLIGAIVGTMMSAFVYGAVVTPLERRYVAARGSAEQDRDILRQELALLRRVILAIDLLLFCALGYWIGTKVTG